MLIARLPHVFDRELTQLLCNGKMGLLPRNTRSHTHQHEQYPALLQNKLLGFLTHIPREYLSCAYGADLHVFVCVCVCVCARASEILNIGRRTCAL